MKKWFLFSAVLVFFLSQNLFSQENIIKTSLSSAFFGDFNLAYERVINEKGSLQVKAGFLNPMVSFTIGEKRITPDEYWLQEDKGGFHTSVEYRFFLNDNKNTPQGWYIAPYIRHFNQNLLYTDTIEGDLFDVRLKVLNFGIGCIAGWQWISKGGFTFDINGGFGPDYYQGKMKYTLQEPRTGFDYRKITDDINESFNDFNYWQKKLQHKPQSTYYETKIPFFFPGIRLNVSVGYAF